MSEIRSFKNRSWRIPDTDPAAIRALVHAGVPAAAAPVLAARGFDADQAVRFCRISLDREVAAGDRMADLDAAAARLARAARAGEQVAVFGDYDVDGATATAIAVRALRHWGLDPSIYIPDRLSEGYGPNPAAIETLEARGTDLIVFVDTGIAAHDSLIRARELGIDCLVIDHHAVQGELPPAAALVNPNRPDDASGLGHLCAAGVTWLVARAADRRITEEGRQLRDLDLRRLLDLVALGTVADVVPLTGLNRAFVAEGLKVMADSSWVGLTQLATVCGVEAPFSTYHCGFMLGPRINAGGRIGACDTGARLLTTDDPVLANTLATQLNSWNCERQAMEQASKAEALDGLGAQIGPGALFAVGDAWHEGVIGIVASRLKEAYDRPAFVLTRTEHGQLKGSARSMPGFDLGAAVIAAREAGLLTRGGGHPMAAGLTLDAEQLGAFQAFVDARLAESDFARTGAIHDIDAVIRPEQVTRGFAQTMEALAPFGVGAPRPRLLIQNAVLHALRILDDRRTGEPMHLKLEIRSPETGVTIKAMAFKVMGTPLADNLIAAHACGAPLELAGTLRLNTFRGVTSAEIELEDARKPALDPAIPDQAA